MGIPWKAGMLYTAHKELNIYVVILLLSCNDACGPRRRLIAIIQRCIWAPLAAIENLGQLSKDDPKDPKRGLKAPPQR